METEDIYDVHEDLIIAINRDKKILQYSGRFNDIKTNHGKVDFIENSLEMYQQIAKLERRFELQANKNDEQSLQFRKEGNQFYSRNNKDYFKAMQLYNKSICFAEVDSENLAIGYANRSAILLEWKYYKACLENIHMARANNYPDRLKHKLDEREKKCMELMSSHIDNEEPYNFQLISPSHSKLPFIADCIEMRSSAEEGRYIITNKDLKPGDLIAIEEPFCTVLLPAMRYIRCANCNIENYFTLLPCPNCTSAMFCSQKCLDEGTNMFHKYECPIIEILFNLFNKIHLIALRVCLVALTLFDNIEEFKSFCEQPCNQDKSAFDVDYEKQSKREYYRAIHGLVTNQEKRNTSDMSQRSVIAAVLRRFLMTRTTLKNDYLHVAENVNFFTDLLLRHLQTAPSNMHGICLIEHKNQTSDEFSFGSAAYGFASLLNHSCAPNTVRIYNGTELYLFVLRPIPAGGGLFDNYGYHYATQPIDIRQKNLKTQYHFTCKCEACEKNYPLFHNIPAHPRVPEAIASTDIYSLSKYNRHFAQENVKRYMNFLNTYKSYYPCAQISATEESLKMAINILIDAIPLKAKVVDL